MTTEQLRALQSLSFDQTQNEDDIWSPADFHVDGLHPEVEVSVRQRLVEADARPRHNPVGLVIQGEPGVGKTQLLNWTRTQVQKQHGFFFLMYGPHATQDFSTQMLAALITGFLKPADGMTQLERLITDLAVRCNLSAEIQKTFASKGPSLLKHVNAFVATARDAWPDVGRESQDTLRALLLLSSPRQADQDLGQAYMTGEKPDRRMRSQLTAWGIKQAPKTPQRIISETSWLLALSGPTVVAVDQVDAILDSPAAIGPSRIDLARQLAHGLMELHGKTRRTLTVISCFPESWERIKKVSIKSVPDRFHETRQLQNIPSEEIARSIVARRFEIGYRAAGFKPPHATWPIRHSAFKDGPKFTARNLIKRIERHITMCVHNGEIAELASLSSPIIPTPPAVAPDRHHESINEQFNKLVREVDITRAIRHDSENDAMPALLAAGLRAWIAENGMADTFTYMDLDGGPDATLHALLVDTPNRSGQHREWAYRGISTNSPSTAIRRIDKTVDEFHPQPNRRIFLLRVSNWPTGPQTNAARKRFADAGGVEVRVAPHDLRVFSALMELLNSSPTGWEKWLLAERPASRTGMFRDTLSAALPTSE
ncbi:MAG: hypothetical protein QOH97_973 [Actinoplanes sp.]|jgi:hypothetical protein|nr:hypothetical protein [Actinoplanes sp.]